LFIEVQTTRIGPLLKKETRMAKWIEFMKAGTWQDRFGKVCTVTTDMLDKICGNYSAQHPAHIVVGHPDKAVVPSFGVISAVKRVGDKLLFKPANVVTEFSALVKNGSFPGVSAGLNADCSKLQHIAFLSAERPAMTGLKPVLEFSAAPQTDTLSIDISKSFDTVEFSAASDWASWKFKGIGDLLRNIKNYFIEKEGQEKADKLMDEWRLNDLLSDPPDDLSPQFSHASQGGQMDFEKLYAELKSAVDGLLAKFAKPGVTEFSAHVETLASENDRLSTENASLKTRVEQFEIEKRGLEFSAFVETLVTDRKVKPDEKQSIVAALETMHAATTVEFSAASGKKSPLDLFKEELSARSVCIPPTGPEGRGPEFSASPTESGVEIGNKMTVYMKEMAAKGTPVNVMEARKHIMGR
jgi:hypothetical protein